MRHIQRVTQPAVRSRESDQIGGRGRVRGGEVVKTHIRVHPDYGSGGA